MKTLAVIQHVEAEYLGFLEDHLEARNIRFRYFRPFTAGGMLPFGPEGFDGLIVLGQGPLGVVSGPLVPWLSPELRLIKAFLDAGQPVVGIGLGAVLLAVAAGGGAEEAPLRCEIGEAVREDHASAAGRLVAVMPERFAYASYMRDRPVLPGNAEVLARGAGGAPIVFAVGEGAIGFVGHPGIKSAMVEDIVMEFEESPDDIAVKLETLRGVQDNIAAALSAIMVGLVDQTGWMSVDSGVEAKSSPG